MKKKMLQMILVLTLFSKFAKATNLNIRMYNNAWITVVFDGVSYATPTNNLHMEQVTPGIHSMQVHNAYQSGYFHSTLFNGFITINPVREISAVIDQFGNISLITMTNPTIIQSSLMSNILFDPYSYQTYGNNHWNGTNYYNSNQCNNTYGYNQNNYTYSNYGYSNGYNSYNSFAGMNPADFMALKQTVIGRSFDSSKRETLKMTIGSNWFSSEQVRDLMNLLDFESSKLEIAKLAYSKTIDKQNYYKVYDAFSFESSISELNQYIGIH